jgi:hypothetical protein
MMTTSDVPFLVKARNWDGTRHEDVPLALKFVLVAFAAFGFVLPTFNFTFCKV